MSSSVSQANTPATAPTAKKSEAVTTEAEFSLNASESELLEEFGVLLAAEYGYTMG